MGDTPAPAISTEAIYKTADLFESDSPRAACLLKKSSYVDDLIDSQPSKPDALEIALETENMLAKGGFAVKCWQFSGESGPPFIDYERFSDINRVIWVMARLKNIAKNKTFTAGNAKLLTAHYLKEAEDFVVSDVQKSIEDELKKSSSKRGKGGHYASLKPVQDVNGLWVVGERLTRYNAMTPDSSLQRLLPTQHPATLLFMRRAHQAGHGT